MKAYGNWLRFLKESGSLGEVDRIGERLTEKALRAYIRALRDRVAPQTVVTQLHCLSQAVRALDPNADRSLLCPAIGRLQAIAKPKRDKSAALVSPRVLLGLGHRLMATWRDREGHDCRLNAMDYRDGLMIALLALAPIRLANLAEVRIGQHLMLDAGQPRLRFAALSTKGGNAIDVAFPKPLVEHLQYYLDTVRPMIARTPEMADAMWPSLRLPGTGRGTDSL